jgi:hypothetical protein
MKSSLIRLSLALSRFFLFLGLAATVAVMAVYVYHLAANIRSDTTGVTNAAFLITGTLSAISFAWAQALLPDDKDRARVLFAGERLLHGSVFLIIASILKYAALQLATYEMPDLARSASGMLGDIFGVLAAPLFLFAIGNAFTGVLMMYRILWPRASSFVQGAIAGLESERR